MISKLIVLWALALITWKAPAEIAVHHNQYPGHTETVEQINARYLAIATDVATVAYDPAEKPLYAGAFGRARTMTTLLAVAFHESGFAHDVDVGPCYRGKDGKGSRCDGGRSACMLQRLVGTGTTPEGWTQADLFADRQKCFRSGLHRIASSFRQCGKLGPDYVFDGYAGGLCELSVNGVSTTRHTRGLELVSYSSDFYRHAPAPGADSAFLLSVKLPAATPANDVGGLRAVGSR
jgi:hypothetical protein